jgi:hypothetical protein
VGFLPLAHFLDSGGADAIGATIEANADGAVYPVLYVRRAGHVVVHALPGHPLHDFETAEHRRAITLLLTEVGIDAPAVSGSPVPGATVR